MIHGPPSTRRTTRRADCPAQRSFAHLFEEQAGPKVPLASARAEAHERTLAGAVDRSQGSHSFIRDASIARVREELLRWLRAVGSAPGGMGRTITAVDFTNHLDRCGLRPDPETCDLRCTGGMFVKLMHAGVLTRSHYAPNGGGIATGYGSTARPHYTLNRLPTAADLGAIEQPPTPPERPAA